MGDGVLINIKDRENPATRPSGRRRVRTIYDIVGKGSARTLEFRSYFKIPQTQSNTENCVAHKRLADPGTRQGHPGPGLVPGRLSVFDFTDSANPKEIAWFDRGPVDETKLVIGGNWSTYWYNGNIYSNEIQRGLDVFKITDRRLAGAGRYRFPRVNAQTQIPFLG